MSHDDTQLISLQSGKVSAVIDSAHGSRLSSLRFDGFEILVQRTTNESLLWGCYPMVPWAGRMRNATFQHSGSTYHVPCDVNPTIAPHAIHGFVHDAKWTIVDASATEATLRTNFDPRWPFVGWVEQRIIVDSTSIHLQLIVHATDASGSEVTMPAQVGWHPWFSRPVNLGAAFKSMYVRDSEGIATTRAPSPSIRQFEDQLQLPLDDCFTDTESTPTLSYSNGLAVRLESDCSHWVVYNEPRHAICVEPQSGPPNGINSEPLVISPGQPLSRFFRLTALGYH
jgi:aldose 1-epimerase